MPELRHGKGLHVLLAVVVAVVTSVLSVGHQPQQASAQEDPSPTASVVPETTSTLPSGGEVGNIVPRPNSGQAPQDSGDPGGSRQVGLFFGLCVALALMAAFVWWRSREVRAKRAADGRDPLTVATQRGGDVRKPRPPGIVD